MLVEYIETILRETLEMAFLLKTGENTEDGYLYEASGDEDDRLRTRIKCQSIE